MANLLLLEDEKDIGELVKRYLERYGHDCTHFLHPKEALEAVKSKDFDLLILDIMLPEIDGLEVLKRVRYDSQVPIIMLTARDDLTDKVLGLELGADDYLGKPFEPRELLARIDAVLRRNTPRVNRTTYQVGDLAVNTSNRTCTLKGEDLELSTAEFDLLEIFLRHPGEVLTRDDIMNHLQGVDSNVFSRSIDISVSRLRQKLGDDKKQSTYIKTIWGKGYIFIGEEH